MTSALPQIGVSVKGYVYYHGNATPSCGELPLGLVDPREARVSKANKSLPPLFCLMSILACPGVDNIARRCSDSYGLD